MLDQISERFSLITLKNMLKTLMRFQICSFGNDPRKYFLLKLVFLVKLEIFEKSFDPKTETEVAAPEGRQVSNRRRRPW